MDHCGVRHQGCKRHVHSARLCVNAHHFDTALVPCNGLHQGTAVHWVVSQPLDPLLTRHDHHAANRRIAHEPRSLGEGPCGMAVEGTHGSKTSCNGGWMCRFAHDTVDSMPNIATCLAPLLNRPNPPAASPGIPHPCALHTSAQMGLHTKLQQPQSCRPHLPTSQRTRVLVAGRHAVEADAPRVADAAVQPAAVQESSTAFSTTDAFQQSQSGHLTSSASWHVLAPCHPRQTFARTRTRRSMSLLLVLMSLLLLGHWVS